jgi:hypothetical protein
MAHYQRWTKRRAAESENLDSGRSESLMKVRVLTGHGRKVIAIEAISAPRHTYGAREESGSLLSMADQELREQEVSPLPWEDLISHLSRLGIIQP